MAYHRILIATDLTEEADEVLTAAADVKGQSTAVMHAVTVVKPISRVYGGLDMAPITSGAFRWEQDALDQAGKQLIQLCSAYGIDRANCHIKLGAPAVEIKALAEELSADLIVIGTHGRHGLGLLLGSTANAVLHGVKCDVLAVRIHSSAVS